MTQDQQSEEVGGSWVLVRLQAHDQAAGSRPNRDSGHYPPAPPGPDSAQFETLGYWVENLQGKHSEIPQSRPTF